MHSPIPPPSGASPIIVTKAKYIAPTEQALRDHSKRLRCQQYNQNRAASPQTEPRASQAVYNTSRYNNNIAFSKLNATLTSTRSDTLTTASDVSTTPSMRQQLSHDLLDGGESRTYSPLFTKQSIISSVSSSSPSVRTRQSRNVSSLGRQRHESRLPCIKEKSEHKFVVDASILDKKKPPISDCLRKMWQQEKYNLIRKILLIVNSFGLILGMSILIAVCIIDPQPIYRLDRSGGQVMIAAIFLIFTSLLGVYGARFSDRWLLTFYGSALIVGVICRTIFALIMVPFGEAAKIAISLITIPIELCLISFTYAFIIELRRKNEISEKNDKTDEPKNDEKINGDTKINADKEREIEEKIVMDQEKPEQLV